MSRSQLEQRVEVPTPREAAPMTEPREPYNLSDRPSAGQEDLTDIRPALAAKAKIARNDEELFLASVVSGLIRACSPIT